MKYSYFGILAAAVIVGSPALAEMVAASPGVTLTEAAQAKFNHNASGDERIGTVEPGSSGIPAPLYSAAGLCLRNSLGGSGGGRAEIATCGTRRT